MKNLNSKIASLFAVLAIALASIAKGQTPSAPATGSLWSADVYYDLKSHISASVADYKIKTFSNIFGNPKFSVEFSAFGGVDLRTSNPIGGFALTKSVPLAAGVNLTLGAGWSVANSKPNGVGLLLGLSASF